jgi:hypothetical protein
MDAKDYMDQIVDPTIADFEANPTSRHCAFLACVAAFHTVDYIAQPGPSKNMRQTFRNNTDFAAVDRVAHAFKHVETSGSPRAVPPQMKADDAIERPPALWVVGVYDVSRYDDATGGVQAPTAITPDDLLVVVMRAAAFLRTHV